MKLFKMGDISEGENMLQSYIGLWWCENITDIPPGIYLQNVFLTLAFPLPGYHYDIEARSHRYGWWMHWFCFYREDRWPLPVVGFMKSISFHKEKN